MEPSTTGAARRRLDTEPFATSGDDERELVASVLRRDRKAAARFVAAHIDAVYAYARQRLTPRAELADDVVQDVFLAALDGLSTFRRQSSLRSWLIGIARHKIEDVYRQRLHVRETLDEGDASDTEPVASTPALDDQIDAARTRAKARQVIALMPERYGLVLLWRYWEHRARFKELWIKEERDVR